MKHNIISILRIGFNFLLLSTAVVLLFFSVHSFARADKRIIEFDTNNMDALYLNVSDLYGTEGNESLWKLFSSENAVEQMADFNHILAEKYYFMEFDTQSIMIKDNFPYKDQFRIDYEREDYGENDEIGISLHSAQMNSNLYNSMKIYERIESGRGFEKEDYFYDGKQAVPVILGGAYADIAKIGMIYKFSFLFREINLQVVGVLEDSTYVTINGNITSLDKSIIVPLFDTTFAPETPQDLKFQGVLYSIKNWGNIRVQNGDNYYAYRDEVSKISKELGLKYVLQEGLKYENIKNISASLNSNKGTLLLFSIFLFCLFFGLFAFIQISSYHRQRRTLAIKLVCGYSLIRVKTKLFLELFITCGFAIVLAALINKNLLGYDYLYYTEKYIFDQSLHAVILSVLFVVAIICCIINKFVNKDSICLSLAK